MTIRASQAFAACRKATIAELMNKLMLEFVPDYNAEIADIRRQYDNAVEFADREPISAKPLIEAADSRRKARIFDLAKRKQEFIDSLRVHLRLEMTAKAKEYNGEAFEEVEQPKEEGMPPRIVTKVKFPDGSVARVASNLFIDYSVFDRV